MSLKQRRSTYDEARLSEGQLKGLVKGCGFGCGEPLSESIPALGGDAHALHEMQRGGATATMAMPPARPVMDRAAHAAAAQPTMKRGGMGEGMMEHDMSEPAMAKQMEAEVRTRFFMALVLSIPGGLPASASRNPAGSMRGQDVDCCTESLYTCLSARGCAFAARDGARHDCQSRLWGSRFYS